MPVAVSLPDALEQLTRPGVSVLAGGTDFYPALQDRPAPADVLDITRIQELKAITKEHSGWRIGAGATWSHMINADVPPVFDGLKAAGREVGSVQIQNAATLAGNLCNASPAADGVPPLLSLNAEVELASQGGIRVLPLHEFILGVRQTAIEPGELLTAILIPNHSQSAVSQFYKLGARTYLVISIAMIAITIVPDDKQCIEEARITVGSCSPVASRLSALETDLVGRPLNKALVDVVRTEHLSDLSPIDDVRGSADYRLHAVHEILQRQLMSCALQLCDS